MTLPLPPHPTIGQAATKTHLQAAATPPATVFQVTPQCLPQRLSDPGGQRVIKQTARHSHLGRDCAKVRMPRALVPGLMRGWAIWDPRKEYTVQPEQPWTAWGGTERLSEKQNRQQMFSKGRLARMRRVTPPLGPGDEPPRGGRAASRRPQRHASYWPTDTRRHQRARAETHGGQKGRE